MSKKISRRSFIKRTTIASISITPAIGALSQIIGCNEFEASNSINCAFRLTKYENLLNLEFYFINMEYKDNCLFSGRKLLSFFQQEESYMIVRLPQQHIAEQYFDMATTKDGCNLGEPTPEKLEELKKFIAATSISGYSYLVFRVMFPPNENEVTIKLTEDSLMDWNNNIFKLVVRQNLNESLFVVNANVESELEFKNNYPFNYSINNSVSYDYNKFPKVYGDPITAIEAPWRLILSPKLPDQDRFEFKWTFSKNPSLSGKRNVELWLANLNINEKKGYVPPRKDDDKIDKLEQITNKLELMILGSPDELTTEIVPPAYKIFNYPLTPTSTLPIKNQILPTAKDKRDLVDLYIKFKLLARTEQLSLSPLGISTYIEFKNEKFEETSEEGTNIKLFSWKHLISLGKDEEVEIVKLILDKEFGNKMLHIISSKRRTKVGISYLDYREYIMPLELEKNYTFHENEQKDGKVISKFNSPFKKIEILDTKPKRICPIDEQNYTTIQSSSSDHSTEVYKDAQAIVFQETDSANKFFAYIPKVKSGTEENFLEFDYKATDWQGNEIYLRKKLQAIQYEAIDFINNKSKDPISENIEKIEKLFNKGDKLKEYEDKLEKFNKRFVDILSSVKKIGDIDVSPLEQLMKLKYVMTSIKKYKDSELLLFNDALIKGAEEFKDLITVYKNEISFFYVDMLPIIESLIKKIGDETNLISLFDLPKNQIISELRELKKIINAINKEELKNLYKIIAKKFSEFTFEQLRDSINVTLAKEVFDTSYELYEAEKKITNLIKTYNQKIGFAVEDLKTEKDKILSEGRNELSKLQTEYLIFKGELKTIIENEKIKKIEFFNTYASMPQMQQAKVYINSLNKLVNEEIPVSIKYAKDYVNNQLSLAELEVQKNVSRVFAEVTESSREALKGKIRQVASDMGGYVNPEIPVEFLTYLKDPKKIPDKLSEELIRQFPDLKQYENNLREGYNDLVFISETAKEEWNQLKSIKPDNFFKGLEAKILGSISLKDILGLDFEMPRLTELPDRIIYNFMTDKITDKDFSILKFYAKNRGQKSSLQIYLEKSIKNSSEYTSFTRLSNFSLAIRLSDDILTVLFNKLEFKSSNTQASKTDVKIDDVVFGGPLNFLGKLAEAIKLPGTGLRIRPSFQKIDIGFTFALPSIETPAFNLSNLKFDIGMNIPLPTSSSIKPITFSFGINKPDDKFLVSVGIFGGRGHFIIETSTEKLQRIDAAIEFGGYLGINLGIAQGYVYLFAGIRYQWPGNMISAYLVCGGGVNVLGIISVSVVFLLLLQYEGSTNSLYGTASVTYNIKMLFFKKSFTLSYSKRIAGAKGKKVDPDDSTGALFNGEERVLYAYDRHNYLNRKEISAGGKRSIKSISKNPKSFKKIYDEESWKIYCNSFSLN